MPPSNNQNGNDKNDTQVTPNGRQPVANSDSDSPFGWVLGLGALSRREYPAAVAMMRDAEKQTPPNPQLTADRELAEQLAANPVASSSH